MKIDGQPIINTDKQLVMVLKEPFWSAYQKYQWENQEAGFGVSLDLIREAKRENKKIIVMFKGLSYEISYRTIENYYKEAKVKPNFFARGGVKLIVIPQSKFTRKEKRFDKAEYEKKEAERERINQKRLFNL